MDWIHLAEGAVHCLAVLNVVTLGSMWGGKFTDQVCDTAASKEGIWFM